MRLFSLLILVLICGCTSTANLHYTTKTNNTFYAQVANSIFVKSNSKKPVEMMVINGDKEIVPVKLNDTTYSVRVEKYPAKKSYLIIKQGSEVVKERIRIVDLPAPKILLLISNDSENYVTDKEITKERFKNVLKLIVMFPDFPFDMKVDVLAYDIMIVKGGGKVYEFKSSEDGILPRGMPVESGDTVVFSNIKFRLAQGVIDTSTGDYIVKVL